MPDFQGCQNFPAPGDSLAKVPSGSWGDLVFAGVRPDHTFAEFLAPVTERLDWLPFNTMKLDPESLRDYEFDGHWALYNDNYLEGFHVPYVHPGLARVLDYSQYRTELLPGGTLQVGISKEGESYMEPPKGHQDHGQRVAGYYFWLFPTTMINVYPWGLSLNAVQPQGSGRTQVHFRSYVWDASLQALGAGGDLKTVELEDEAVVENVQQGVRSRFYDRGRYSPSQEVGVHHFHRLLLESLDKQG
jgi:choline monooxygenase